MFLSIIIPVYNLEQYIEECIESCLNQSFKDYEIICVNDGSEDNSASILDEYAQKHPEIIRVIHKQKGGVSSARNEGMKIATGKWLWFVDGDDYVSKNCISVMFNNISAQDEFIMFDSFKSKEVISLELEDENLKVVDVSKEKSFSTFPTNNFAGGAWSYWFRKDIIDKNGLCFDQRMRYSEDVKFTFQYKLFCEHGGKLFDNIIYGYRKRESSAMHSVNYEEQISCMKILIQVYHNAVLQMPEIKEVFLQKRIEALKVIQYDLMYKIRDYNRTVREIMEFERLGVYPYKYVKNSKDKKIKKSKKAIVVEMIERLFGNKTIFLFLCKILSKKSN